MSSHCNLSELMRKKVPVATGRQVRILRETAGKGKSLIVGASKADMDGKTHRRYSNLGTPPDEVKVEHI